MADDEKKLTDSEAENNPESKDWKWDAAAPLAGKDFLEESISNRKFNKKAEESEDEDDDDDDDFDDDSDEEEKGRHEYGDGHCIICGKKITNSQSENYCNECRTKYLKVDYGATHIILSIVMVFIAIIGIVTFYSTAKITSAVNKADKLAEEGKLSAATDAYNEVDEVVTSVNGLLNAFNSGVSGSGEEAGVAFFSSGASIGKKRAALMAKSFSLSYDDPDAFMNLVDNSFTKKELDKKENAQIKGCYNFVKDFISGYTKVNNDLQNAYTPLFESAQTGGMSQKEIDKKIADILDATDKYAAKHSDVSSGVISYFKFGLLYSAKEYCNAEVSDADLYGYIQNTYDDAGDYGYMFYQDISSFALSLDKYEDVITLADKAIKVNSNNADAYYYSAIANLRLEKFDAALKACDKVAELTPGDYESSAIKANILRRQKQYAAAIDICEAVPAESKSAEISRQEAIAYYLAEDEENAVKYAKESYDAAYAASYSGGSFSLEVVNTSALIYKLCGAEEDYDTVTETLAQSNAKLEDSVMAVINGDSTFEDLFMTGKGDI